MAPRVQALAQSESKARFMERLGLDEGNESHRRIYSMMKEEAVEGRKRINASEDALVPALRGDPAVQPPYSNAQISETAMHRETLLMYRTARPETKAYYDLGHDMETVEQENWVIRWMLWHVFRYRDNRNRNRRNGSPGSDTGGTSGSPNARRIPGSFTGATGGSTNDARSNNGGGSTFWDPVRDS